MTVILFSIDDSAILICPLILIRKYSLEYHKLIFDENKVQSYLEGTFDIKTPFLMDGEAKKIAAFISQDTSISDKSFSLDKFFKLKEKTPIRTANLSEDQTSHTDLIVGKLLTLKRYLKFLDYFNFVPSGADYNDNNSSVRHSVERLLELTNYSTTNVFGCNESSEFVIHEVKNQKFLIPPKSKYICNNIFDLSSHFLGETFDFIIIDPPWRNKHVRRRKKSRGLGYGYNMLSVAELMKIPIKNILSFKAIVLIWITNSNDINKEFQNSLNIWDLELVTTWYWMKLTKSGEPVVHSSITHSRGKQSCEKILITRKRGFDGEGSRVIPKELLLCSIPSGIHSHKPPLNDVLIDTLGLNCQDKCLEMFARNLLPGWTSFGLEALKFQNVAAL